MGVRCRRCALLSLGVLAAAGCWGGGLISLMTLTVRVRKTMADVRPYGGLCVRVHCKEVLNTVSDLCKYVCECVLCAALMRL